MNEKIRSQLPPKGLAHPCWGEYGMGGHKWRYTNKVTLAGGEKVHAKRRCSTCGEEQFLDPYGD